MNSRDKVLILSLVFTILFCFLRTLLTTLISDERYIFFFNWDSLHARLNSHNEAFYQNNEQTSLEKKEVEPVEPVLKNIYRSNTYRKDLSWPLFDDEPRVQDKQQVKDQQSCICVFVAYPTISSSILEHQPRHDNSTPCMAAW